MSVTAKDCICQNRVREAVLKGSLLFCLTAVNRCIQEISARQDAAPHLAKETAYPELKLFIFINHFLYSGHEDSDFFCFSGTKLLITGYSY